MPLEGQSAIEQNLSLFVRNATELSRSAAEGIPISDLLSPKFLEHSTKFESLDDLNTKAAAAGLGSVNDPGWEDFIRSNSRFESWHDLVSAAFMVHMQAVLGEGDAP